MLKEKKKKSMNAITQRNTHTTLLSHTFLGREETKSDQTDWALMRGLCREGCRLWGWVGVGTFFSLYSIKDGLQMPTTLFT